LPGADPTTFAEGPDTTPAGTTAAGAAAPNNAFDVGTTAAGTGTGGVGTRPVPTVAAEATVGGIALTDDTGGSPDRADREPVPVVAAARGTPPRTTPSRTTPSARTADAGSAAGPAEPRPRRETTGPLSAAADLDADRDAEESAEPDAEESPRPPSA
jgi:hypothetical protein